MKTTKKTLSISKLVVDLDLNVRLASNYDIPTMKVQITDLGRIVNPIVVEEMENGIYKVLQGNRRTLAGQELYSDPATPAGLKEALDKTDVIVYKDLSPEERLRIIMDQGSQKSINRTELVLAVWRLSRQFFSEKQIVNLLYFALAKYTGNEKKLNEVPAEPKARDLYLSKWLHGTVGNTILMALRFPEFVREEFIKTHKAQDGLLKEGEKVLVKCSRERIGELSKAKGEDEKADQWSPETGGPKFNEVWQRFVKEDAGEVVETGPKRPSVNEVKAKADQFQSRVVRTALLASIGEPATDLLDLDAEVYRMQGVVKVLSEAFDSIQDPTVKEMARLCATGKPGDLKNWIAGK